MRGLSFGELLDYSSEETNHWRDWFAKNPNTLDLPCDIAGTKMVREVMLHIVAVQMRYAERLLNLPITEFDELNGKSAVELFALAQKARKTFVASPSPPTTPIGTALLPSLPEAPER